MAELTVPDVLHRLPPLVEEAKSFLRKVRTSRRPRIRVWKGPSRGFGAVYPGSFDPWTRTHEAILRATMRRVRGPLLVLLDLYTVDKPSHGAPLAERLAILALHFAGDRRVAIGVSTHGRFLEKARALGRATFIVGEDTMERVLAPQYYEDPERELAELHRRAKFITAPRGGRGSLPLSRADQARSATLARQALSRGRLPWDHLAPDVLLACWQLRLYGNPRLLPVWVVTAFLQRGGCFLLVKRGQRVGTHRGAWSGVSGYLDWPAKLLRALIERGPGRSTVAQVLKEIHEETGIAPEWIRVVHAGAELTAADAPHSREWRVHPFHFRLIYPGPEPRLDWENVELRWVYPWDLLHLPTVPRLLDAFERACGPWRVWHDARLRELEVDRRSGAMEIALRFLRSLADDDRVSGLRDLTIRSARRLAKAHPMAPLAWVRDRLASGRTSDYVHDELGRQDSRVHRQAVQRLRRVREVATFSYSFTVSNLLGWWPYMNRKRVTIIPDAEGNGRRMHRELLRPHRQIRFSNRPPRDAVIVLGCDAVLPDGSIINARGTAKAIRDAGLPVVILAQRCKYVKRAPKLRRGFERVPASLLRDAEFIS